jgi:imidazolonepropionase-like amidohydrolase
MQRLSIFILMLFLYINNFAQYTPSPAPEQKTPIILNHAIIHNGLGEVLEDFAIVIINGKIDYIGKIAPEIKDAQIIDVQLKHVYPGLIAPNTVLGLKEIESVRATLDNSEVGNYNNDVRTIIAYNTDSQVIPTVRSNGILISQIIPEGGIISGTSSIVQLDAWNWEDAALKMEDGIHLNWPQSNLKKDELQKDKTKKTNKYVEEVQEINAYFNEAKSYYNIEPEIKNLRFKALRMLFANRMSLYVHVNGAYEILDVLLFAKKIGIKNLVLVGAKESYKIPNDIAKAKASVILSETHDLPTFIDENIDQPFSTPKILKDAGVLFCLMVNGSWQVRNLPFMAGTAAAYGLTKEEALQSITLNTAKILGIDNITGSIEIGKQANLVISKGDILDMRTNQIEYAFLKGRSINLRNKQIDLYEKYKQKYQIEN